MSLYSFSCHDQTSGDGARLDMLIKMKVLQPFPEKLRCVTTECLDMVHLLFVPFVLLSCCFLFCHHSNLNAFLFNYSLSSSGPWKGNQCSWLQSHKDLKQCMARPTAGYIQTSTTLHSVSRLGRCLSPLRKLPSTWPTRTSPTSLER